MCSSRQEGENEATKRLKTEFLVQMTGSIPVFHQLLTFFKE